MIVQKENFFLCQSKISLWDIGVTEPRLNTTTANHVLVIKVMVLLEKIVKETGLFLSCVFALILCEGVPFTSFKSLALVLMLSLFIALFAPVKSVSIL